MFERGARLPVLKPGPGAYALFVGAQRVQVNCENRDLRRSPSLLRHDSRQDPSGSLFGHPKKSMDVVALHLTCKAQFSGIRLLNLELQANMRTHATQNTG